MRVGSFRPPGGWSNGCDGHTSGDKAPARGLDWRDRALRDSDMVAPPTPLGLAVGGLGFPGVL